jgi:hypothetical protein
LFRTLPEILKIVPKAGYEFTKKSTNESRGKPEQKFDAEKLRINFSLEQDRLKIKKESTESIDLIV